MYNHETGLPSGLVSAMLTAISLGMVSGYRSGVNVVQNGVDRKSYPWDRIQLSKAERRGKGPEEIQALRKAKWEAMRGGEA